MADSTSLGKPEHRVSLLIPLDADEALLALQRFRRTGAGEAPFVLEGESRRRLGPLVRLMPSRPSATSAS